MRRPRFSSMPGQRFYGLARFRKPSLCGAEQLLARPLRFLGAPNRGFRFRTARLECRLLFLGGTALHGNHRRLAGEPHDIVFGTRQLRLVTDDVERKAMLLFSVRGDSGNRLTD